MINDLKTFNKRSKIKISHKNLILTKDPLKTIKKTKEKIPIPKSHFYSKKLC